MKQLITEGVLTPAAPVRCRRFNWFTSHGKMYNWKTVVAAVISLWPWKLCERWWSDQCAYWFQLVVYFFKLPNWFCERKFGGSGVHLGTHNSLTGTLFSYNVVLYCTLDFNVYINKLTILPLLLTNMSKSNLIRCAIVFSAYWWTWLATLNFFTAHPNLIHTGVIFLLLCLHRRNFLFCFFAYTSVLQCSH